MTDNQLEKIDRLIGLRHEMGWKQQQMADLLGIVRTSLSKIESKDKGRYVPKGTGLMLQFALGISADWFETGIGEKRLTIDGALTHFNELIKKWGIAGDDAIIELRKTTTGRNLPPNSDVSDGNAQSPEVEPKPKKEMVNQQVINTYEKYIKKIEDENEDLKRQLAEISGAKAKKNAS